MHSAIRHLALPILITAVLAACEQGTPEQTPAPPPRSVTFADHVYPILQEHCAECHQAGGSGAEDTGFRVDSYASLMQGSNYGPVIEPGTARTSSLFILISSKDHLTVSMPRDRPPLSDEEIETIRAWIDNGAPDN
jgi:mono/diheme cytochrome c family protein